MTAIEPGLGRHMDELAWDQVHFIGKVELPGMVDH
jgi:hypothetical protein